MTHIATTPERLAPDSEQLGVAILEALAQVRAAPVAELRDEMVASGGDLEIDSREAEAVIAILEHRYGRDLAKVEDLEPERLPSVGSLSELIHRRWPADQPVAAGRAG
jgi:acyl carrier protein